MEPKIMFRSAALACLFILFSGVTPASSPLSSVKPRSVAVDHVFKSPEDRNLVDLSLREIWKIIPSTQPSKLVWVSWSVNGRCLGTRLLCAILRAVTYLLQLNTRLVQSRINYSDCPSDTANDHSVSSDYSSSLVG